MRIAVFGAGGIGGYFGARLAQAGDEVALIARGPHLAAIRERGLFVESPTGDFTATPFIATDDPEEVGVVDVVIIGVKAWDVPAAAEAIRPMVGPGTGVLTLQNGVEAPTEVGSVLGQEHVIVGVSPVRSLIAAPGRLRCLGGIDPNLTLGEFDNRASDRVEHVRSALATVGVTVRVPEDIHSWLWGKFIGVSAVGLGAVLRVSLTRIHRRTSLGTALEEASGCSSESGIMVLEQKPARKQGAPNRCCHRTNPTVSASSLTTIAWWPMPACSCRPP